MSRPLFPSSRPASLRRFLRRALTLTIAAPLLGGALLSPALTVPAQAQNFRFILRAEPDVIAANGISTTSIFVQLPPGRVGIAATQTVRFATTAGTIEGQAQLAGGVARVLLRSSNTPGTAIVTAFIGSSREAITVEFSEENGLAQRTLEIAAPYVAYGSDASQITASGQTGFDFGDTHIESDVRLDVDLTAERVWAEGTKGRVIIRQGRGAKAKELRGDRLFYDLRRKSGVIRRSEASENAPARQEFVGADFAEPPEPAPNSAVTLQSSPDTTGTAGAPGTSPTNSAVASPSKRLETPGNRGSIFVTPKAPPITGAPDEKSDRPDTVTPPILLPNPPADPPAATPTDSQIPAITPTDPTTGPIIPALTNPAPAPIAPATAPGTQPSTPTPPATKPEAPAIKPTAPATKPEAPAIAPATPATKPQAPVTAPEAPVSAPKPPATTPEAPVSAPTVSATTPTAPVPFKNGDSSVNGAAARPEAPPVSTLVPGSEAAPGALLPDQSRVQSLANMPRATGDGDAATAGASALPNAPAYAPLPAEGPTPRIVELPPPLIDSARGYWVAARRVRVFPRDKVQFERASIYFNGAKAFAAPLYVLPLDGSFNPTTDTISFNSAGGVGLKFPFYYQATKSGTGAVYLKREQSAGFSESGGGFSLALDQQYWLSPQSHGSFSVDNVGLGAFNLNYQHQLQISPTTSGSFFLSAPRHRDLFARASVAKEMQTMQLGFEGFFDKAQNTQSNVRGQFFARLRPKQLAKSGWSYSLSANALAVQRYTTTLALNASTGSGTSSGTSSGGGLGGGIGGPISGGSGTGTGTTAFRTRALLGQTLNASLQSPLYSPWRGSSFTANLLATAFNYSNGGRGFGPGANLSFSQKLGKIDARMDYTYDKSNIGLYGIASSSFTNYVSGTVGVQFSPKVGLSSFLSRSLNDGATYGSADLSYFVSPKWRVGLFGDYSDFSTSASSSLFNYGGSIGRALGSREVSLNYDAQRGRFYFELSNGRY